MPVESIGVNGLVACLKHGIFEFVIGKVDACVTMQQMLNAIAGVTIKRRFAWGDALGNPIHDRIDFLLRVTGD